MRLKTLITFLYAWSAKDVNAEAVDYVKLKNKEQQMVLSDEFDN